MRNQFLFLFLQRNTQITWMILDFSILLVNENQRSQKRNRFPVLLDRHLRPSRPGRFIELYMLVPARVIVRYEKEAMSNCRLVFDEIVQRKVLLNFYLYQERSHPLQIYLPLAFLHGHLCPRGSEKTIKEACAEKSYPVVRLSRITGRENPVGAGVKVH